MPEANATMWKNHAMFGTKFNDLMQSSWLLANTGSVRSLKRNASAAIPSDVKKAKKETVTADPIPVQDVFEVQKDVAELMKTSTLGNTRLEAYFLPESKILIGNPTDNEIVLQSGYQILFHFTGKGAWRHGKQVADQVHITRK